MTTAPKYPKTVRLLNGQESKIVKVHYPMTRTVYRVEYEGQKGCLAEWLPYHFQEIDPDTYRSLWRQNNG